jgi:hypothetical protein
MYTTFRILPYLEIDLLFLMTSGTMGFVEDPQAKKHCAKLLGLGFCVDGVLEVG